jgi:hypothetical protein
LKSELLAKPDYEELVQKYWKKFNLGLISFKGASQNVNKISGSPLSFIKHKF